MFFKTCVVKCNVCFFVTYAEPLVLIELLLKFFLRLEMIHLGFWAVKGVVINQDVTQL